MKIHRVNHNYIHTLVELRLTYLQYHFGELSKDEQNQLLKQLPDYFTRHLEKDFFAYIAEDEGKAVSTAFLVINEKPANPNFITGKTGMLLNVYTDPDYRRQGIATKILKELIEIAKKENLSYIEIVATEAGIPVYRKLGFIEKVADNMEMRLDLLD